MELTKDDYDILIDLLEREMPVGYADLRDKLIFIRDEAIYNEN